MGKGGEDKGVNKGPIGLPEGQNDAHPGVFSYVPKPVWISQRAVRKNDHHLV